MAKNTVPFGSGQSEPIQVTLVVGLKDWVGHSPDRIWIERFELAPHEANNVGGYAEDFLEGNAIEGYSLQSRSGRTSWGADGSPFLDFALFMSAAAATQVVVRGVDLLFDRIRETRSAHQTEPWRSPLSRDEAIENARWFVIAGYQPAADTLDSTPGPTDQLEVVSETHDVEANRWTVCFRDTEGTTYKVTLADQAGIPSPSLIERTRRDTG